MTHFLSETVLINWNYKVCNTESVMLAFTETHTDGSQMATPKNNKQADKVSKVYKQQSNISRFITQLS